MSMLMLDVDDFKKHNDTYGHQHGDAVLQGIASCLKSELRPTDLITRYGGEEFAILAEETDAAGASALANRLLQTVRLLKVNGCSATLSIGVAELTVSMRKDADLIESADRALFAAKRAGKNRVVFYAENLSQM